MIFRRMEDGAEKWALRDLRREEETSNSMKQSQCTVHCSPTKGDDGHPKPRSDIQPTTPQQTIKKMLAAIYRQRECIASATYRR